jgi:LAGLIDADG DNA endonuclease family
MKNNINLKLVRFYRKSAKYNLELSTDLKEILIGLMLGDLFAEKINPNSNTRLQFKQSITLAVALRARENKVYIDYLYNIFKEYCNSEPKETSSVDKRPGKKELNVSIKFWTQSPFAFELQKQRYLVLINLGNYFMTLAFHWPAPRAKVSQEKNLYL